MTDSPIPPPPTCLPKSGDEPFHAEYHDLGFSLANFWQWSSSNLVSNVTRGVLAEYIVARAVGLPLTAVRNEWDAWDLVTPSGITVEVKSSAYLQNWRQNCLSRPVFRIPPTRAWDSVSGRMDSDSRRQADVYVFALLAHTNRTTLDPLNVSQWRFYVVPTPLLNNAFAACKSVSLAALQKIPPIIASYDTLESGIERAARPGYALLPGSGNQQ